MLFKIIWLTVLGGCLLWGCNEVKYETKEYNGQIVDDGPDDNSPDTDSEGTPLPTGDPCAADAPWSCHPVTGEGCISATAACDYGENADGVAGFYCFTDSTEALGAPCDGELGPWCASGLTCIEGVCARYCCSNDDCEASAGPTCAPLDWPSIVGPLGICTE